MKCSHSGCEEEATTAVRTIRSERLTGRRPFYTAIHWDVDSAPRKAEGLCEEHLTGLVVSLIKVLA